MKHADFKKRFPLGKLETAGIAVLEYLPDKEGRYYGYKWCYKIECDRCGCFNELRHYSIVERIRRGTKRCHGCRLDGVSIQENLKRRELRGSKKGKRGPASRETSDPEIQSPPSWPAPPSVCK